MSLELFVVPCESMVVVDDMTRADLARIDWSGSPTHIANVTMQLDRRDAGVLEYLVARDADGAPVAKGAIDYEETPGAGTVMQLATRSDLEGRGLATAIIAESERRIAARGLTRARLAVEPDNERARRLYEHLGYREVGRRTTGWESDAGWYSTVVVDLEKSLQPA